MPKLLQRCVTSLSVSSKVPSSSKNSTRSRADILPSLCCRSRRCAPPPSRAIWSRFLSSAIFSSSFIGRHYRRGVIAIRRSLFADRFSPCANDEQRIANSASRPQGCGVKQIQKLDLLLCRQKRRFKRIARQFSQMFIGEAERLLYQRVLLNQRGAKHGGIVAVERQHQALVEVTPNRMLRDCHAAARPQIAGHADFNRNLALG